MAHALQAHLDGETKGRVADDDEEFEEVKKEE